MIDWLLQTMTNSKKNPITKLDDLGELLIKRMTISEKKLVMELLPLFEANNIAEAGKLFTENYPRNGYSDSFDRWYSVHIWTVYQEPIEQELKQYDFTGAMEIFLSISTNKPRQFSLWFDKKLKYYKEQQFDKLKPSIEKRLQEYDFAGAKRILSIFDITDTGWFEQRLKYYKEQQLKVLIEKKLRQYNFTEAERILSKI